MPVVDVLAVGSGVTEGLVTRVTDERLLAAVESTVFHQMVLVFESLLAHVTSKWTLTCVTHPHTHIVL